MTILEKFDIRNFVDQLEPTSQKGRYKCPVCDGGSFTISADGAYKCWSGDCDSAAIREAIKPLSEALSEAGGSSAGHWKPQLKTKVGNSAQIPDRVEVSFAYASDRPQWEESKFSGFTRQKIYEYSQTQRVVRFEKDADTAKGYEKTFRQYHKASGCWVAGKGDEKWPAYRIDEAIASGGKTWLIVEGEDCCDAARVDLGFPSITFQGSAWTHEALKSLCSIANANDATLAMLPDNDKAGRKKATALEKAADSSSTPFVLLDPTQIAPGLAEKGDVVDMIASLGAETVKAAIVAELNRVVSEKRKEQEKKAQAQHMKEGSLSAEETIAQIKKILTGGRTNAEQYTALVDCFQRSPFKHELQFSKLVAAVQADLQNPHDADALREEVMKVVAQRRNTFSAKTMFPHLGEAIAKLGAGYGHNTFEFGLVGTLLACAAGQISANTYMEAPSRNINKPYKTPAIFNFMIVGSSGIGKDEIMNAGGVDALRKMRLRDHSIYTEELKEYKAKYKQWEVDCRSVKKGEEIPEEPKAPTCRHYMIERGTVEGINRIFVEQPEVPLLEARSELAGQLKGYGEYKNGGGSDREAYLEFYNGHGFFNPRAGGDGFGFAPKAHLSVVGGIQPSKLKQCIGRKPEEDTDGLWTRYAYVRLPDNEAPFSRTNVNLEAWISSILQRLAEAPAMQFKLSPEAEALALEWHEVSRVEGNGEESPFFQPFWRRSRAMVARTALIAHMINAAANGKQPEVEVSAQTYQAAIEFVEYSINQAYQIFAEVGVSTMSPEATRMADFAVRYAQKELLWSDVRTHKGFKTNGRAATKDEVCAFFQKVCEAGEAIALDDDYSRIFVTSAYLLPEEAEPLISVLDSVEVKRDDGVWRNGLKALQYAAPGTEGINGEEGWFTESPDGEIEFWPINKIRRCQK